MKYCPFKRNVMNKDYRGCLVFNNDNNVAKIEIEFGECDERNGRNSKGKAHDLFR